jgi:pyruvoyl-dependent arginine decarboxylase (PvlArgDC)
MKNSFKTVLMLSFLLLSILGNSQDKQIFESPKIQEFISTHKKVAILPFNATIGYRKLPKDYNAEANKEEEMKLGYDMQSGMYTFLLRKISDYSVEVQDIERTNILLKKNNLIDKLAETAPEELAKVLEVDAVIKCSYAYQKTKSEGGAIALTLLVGFGTGSVATGTLTMQINDGKEGELVWRFYKQMAEDVMSSPASMMERMMRKVGRNFPYQK